MGLFIFQVSWKSCQNQAHDFEKQFFSKSLFTASFFLLCFFPSRCFDGISLSLELIPSSRWMLDRGQFSDLKSRYTWSESWIVQCRSLGLKLKDIFAKINFELGYELFFELFKFAHKLLLLNFNEFISKEMNLYRDSMVGSVIQANGMVDFEDGLRTGILPRGCWGTYGSRI